MSFTATEHWPATKAVAEIFLMGCLLFLIFVAVPHINDRLIRKIRGDKSVFSPMIVFRALKEFELYAFILLVLFGLQIFIGLKYLNSLERF
jgi:hypothetical protein